MWKCPICKSDNDDDAEKCKTCGNYPPVPAIIKLYGHNQLIIVLTDKSFGKENFRIFGREKFQYSEKKQFKLEKTSKGWKISGFIGTTNPTLLNGKDVSGKEKFIHENDKIQVGPILLKVQYK